MTTHTIRERCCNNTSLRVAGCIRYLYLCYAGFRRLIGHESKSTRYKFNVIFLSYLRWLSYLYKLNAICLCVCLDVKQGGKNHNVCTQRLVILHAQTY